MEENILTVDNYHSLKFCLPLQKAEILNVQKTIGYQTINNWLSAQGRTPFLFQQETWQHIADGKSGLVNAPTGSLVNTLTHRPIDAFTHYYLPITAFSPA